VVGGGELFQTYGFRRFDGAGCEPGFDGKFGSTLVVHRVTRECGDDRKLLLSGHGGKYKPVCSCKRVLCQD
jgi:hypothetical protein